MTSQDSTQAGGFVASVMDLADAFAYSEDLREQAVARDKLLDHLTTHASQQAAVVAGLVGALTGLCRVFPTDSDMQEAGWEADEVNAACDAYDIAKAQLAAYHAMKEQP